MIMIGEHERHLGKILQNITNQKHLNISVHVEESISLSDKMVDSNCGLDRTGQ